MTTYGFIELINVLKQLEQCINNDIELLYEVGAQQGKRHTICMTTDPATRWSSNRKHTIIKWPGGLKTIF